MHGGQKRKMYIEILKSLNKNNVLDVEQPSR